jgi:hypothetical protein
MIQLRIVVKKMLREDYSIQRLLVEFGLGMISGYWQTPRSADKPTSLPIYGADGDPSSPIEIPPVAFAPGFSKTLSSTIDSMTNPTSSLDPSVFTIQQAHFQITGTPSNEAWYPAVLVTQLLSPADTEETMYYGVYGVPGTPARPASIPYGEQGFVNAFGSSPITNTSLYFVTAAPLLDEAAEAQPGAFLYGYDAFSVKVPGRE